MENATTTVSLDVALQRTSEISERILSRSSNLDGVNVITPGVTAARHNEEQGRIRF